MKYFKIKEICLFLKKNAKISTQGELSKGDTEGNGVLYPLFGKGWWIWLAEIVLRKTLVLHAFLHLTFCVLWSFKNYVVGGWKEMFLKYRPDVYSAYGVLHTEDVTSTAERLQRVRSEGLLHCEHTRVLGCLFQRKTQLSGNPWGSLRSSMCPTVPVLSHYIFCIWKVQRLTVYLMVLFGRWQNLSRLRTLLTLRSLGTRPPRGLWDPVPPPLMCFLDVVSWMV